MEIVLNIITRQCLELLVCVDLYVYYNILCCADDIARYDIEGCSLQVNNIASILQDRASSF